MAFKDETGNRYTRLLVLRRNPDPKFKRTAHWFCKCDCGKVKSIHGRSLRARLTKSCGCLQKERVHETMFKHGETFNRINGGKSTTEYVTWLNIKQRCGNPNKREYSSYGGRGIKVCKRWMKFENFLADMGRKPSPDLTIERKNNSLGYTPSNCCWATRQKQSANRDCNFYISAFGKRLCAAEWARMKGILRGTLQKRIIAGWDVEKALITPARKISK